jgi:hypothetical protein
LKENEFELMTDRRSTNRRPFVRPVQIRSLRQEPLENEAFSRDISPEGIGIICRSIWQPFQRATLQVHGLKGKDVVFNAEVRWCEPFGKGWFIVGFSFLQS